MKSFWYTKQHSWFHCLLKVFGTCSRFIITSFDVYKMVSDFLKFSFVFSSGWLKRHFTQQISKVWSYFFAKVYKTAANMRGSTLEALRKRGFEVVREIGLRTHRGFVEWSTGKRFAKIRGSEKSSSLSDERLFIRLVAASYAFRGITGTLDSYMVCVNDIQVLEHLTHFSEISPKLLFPILVRFWALLARTIGL